MVVPGLWTGRTRHAKNVEVMMRRAREVVGVAREEWAPLLAIQTHRDDVTADAVRSWEIGLGEPPPSDVLLAAAAVARVPLHILCGALNEDELATLEARVDRLEELPR